MKKEIRTLAALLITSAAFIACSSSDESIIENPQPANGNYTMTVNASKGDASRDQSRAGSSFGEAQPALAEGKGDGAKTRALTPNGSTLSATWATTENVYVKKGSTWATGSLKPQDNAATATLKGTLENITINSGDNLTLQFPKSGDITYAGQLGTLADIAANFDYATASVTVADVIDGNITSTADANFENQQAIIKFTLLDKANDAAISPSALTVTDGTSTVSLTSIPAATYTANGASNVLYVAFPAAGSAKTITLTATVGDNTYNYEKTGVTFTNGQYYEITVKLPKTVYLSNLTGAYVAQDGDVLKGTLGSNVKISIADGATVTLDGVIINGEDDSKYAWAGITCEGDATIVLAEGSTNTVQGFHSNFPGIQPGPSGKTLTINGTGELVAFSRGHGAGIGSDKNTTCGNICIKGGTIIARNRDNDAFSGAGIGSGRDVNSRCGDITISGGDIEATGLYGSAGIGCGSMGHCGKISITGGTVKATGGNNAAGIGSCYGSDNSYYQSHCGNIEIIGGTVTAKGGQSAPGIGSGNQNSSCGTITIESTVSSVTATKGSDDAKHSIGKGTTGTCGTVTIGGTEYWKNNAYLNGGDTYLTQSPLTYTPTLKSMIVENESMVGPQVGFIIYYLEGETWGQAIANHPTENAGWYIKFNNVYYRVGQDSYLLRSYDDSKPITDTEIVQEKDYEWVKDDVVLN